VLSKVAKTADGAQAIVDVKGLDHMLNLLESDSPDVRERACDLVARLAEHRFLAPAICVGLVALLRCLKFLLSMDKSHSESATKVVP
jgi:hypothetical protein